MRESFNRLPQAAPSRTSSREGFQRRGFARCDPRAVTDREVQAISQFLLKFGHLGCYHITICRPTKEVKQLSREQIGQVVLDIREAWKREGLDVERLYKVAVLAHQYRADQYACLPG